jgi:hypothetical protein
VQLSPSMSKVPCVVLLSSVHEHATRTVAETTAGDVGKKISYAVKPVRAQATDELEGRKKKPAVRAGVEPRHHLSRPRAARSNALKRCVAVNP